VRSGFTPSRGAVRPGEHAAALVHDAVLGPVGHGAPAERVHRDERVAEPPRPERAGDVLAARRLRGVDQPGVHPLVVGGRPDPRPVDADPVVLVELQPAVAVVVAHDEERLGLVERAAAAPRQDAAQQPERPAAVMKPALEPVRQGCKRELAGHHLADRTGDHGVLDHEAVLPRRVGSVVDDRGDAGSRQPVAFRRVGPGTDAVDRLAGRVAEAEHVPVAGEAGPELGGHRQPMHPRAQQHLVAADRPAAHHHDVADDGEGRRVEASPADAERLVADGPPIAGPLDPADGDLGEDVGAVGDRVRQVVHEQCVLGAVVAPRHAVTAARAGLLVDADVVRPGLERDVDRRAIAERPGRRPFECGDLRQRRVRVGVRRRLKDLLGASVSLVEPLAVPAERGRPARIVEHPRLRPERHVRVDERRAAKSTAVEDAHVLPDLEGVEVPRVALLTVHGLDLDVTGRVRRRARVLARVELAASLEEAHGLTGPREARRRDRGPIPGADDDDAVLVAHLAQRTRQASEPATAAA
jgi:hypothetical protein